MYTMIKSGGVYVAVQKSYTVYVAKPITGQQQLAVFDLNGTTYMVTDGTTAGAATPAGINPATMWAATATQCHRNPVRPRLRVHGPTDQRHTISDHQRVPVPGDRREQQHHAVRHHLHQGRQRQHGDGGHA